MWHKTRQRLRNDSQHTIPDLGARIQEIWGSFSTEDCQELTSTMTLRMKAVFNAKGDVTPY